MKKIPANVWYLSLVSFLNDTASEMLYPVLPIFITQVLGAPVAVLGVIEGVAEGTAAFLKTVFGNWSDRAQRRKPFIVGGYACSAFSKIIIAFSSVWPMVFLGRFADRFGKGVRTGARDALLLEAADKDNKGFIFGFHRAMDTAGAVVGPSIALILLAVFHDSILVVLKIAIIPAFLSLIFFVFVKETAAKIISTKTQFSFALKNLPPQFKLFLLGIAVFSLGNSSDTFLILKAKNLGMGLTTVIAAYIVYNLVYALSSTPAGIISDRIGQKKVFITGIAIFTLVYLGFALNHSPLAVWFLFGIYGFYIALTDGISKALVGQYAHAGDAGTYYGVLATVTSLFAVIASVVGGLLWTFISPSAPFYFAALCAAASLVIFVSLKNDKPV